MSGRTLRRLPLLAHARYVASDSRQPKYEDDDEEEIDSEESSEDESDEEEESLSESIEVWLDAMKVTVAAEKIQMEKVENKEIE